MEIYAHDVAETQMTSPLYLDTQFNVEHIMYHMPESNSGASSITDDHFDRFMSGPTGNFSLRTDRSLSYSDASSQSLSPQLHYQQTTSTHPSDQTFSTHIFSQSLDLSPPSTPIQASNDEPSDEDHKVERRRAQNRAAQRAYRQRKDHNLKQREKEVAKLRDELEKAQRLNATLCKVVAVLRNQLRKPNEDVEEQ